MIVSAVVPLFEKDRARAGARVWVGVRVAFRAMQSLEILFQWIHSGDYTMHRLLKKRKGEEEDSYNDYDDWIGQSRFDSWSDEIIVEFFFLFFNNY